MSWIWGVGGGRFARKRRVVAATLATLAALLVVGFSGAATADPGVVDETYGVDGLASLAQPNHLTLRVASTPSGATWVLTSDEGFVFTHLQRLAPDGSVVGSVPVRDMVETSDEITFDDRRATLVADGEAAFLVLQYPGYDSTIARFLPSLALDTTFGGDGVLSAGESKSGAFANDLGLPVDPTCESNCGPVIAPMVAPSGDGGAFVVVGSASDWWVAKVTADGTLDAGFATNGLASIDALTDVESDMTRGSLQVDSSGRVIVVNVAGALRLQADGSIDSSYGSGEVPGVARFADVAGTTPTTSTTTTVPGPPQFPVLACGYMNIGECSSTVTADGSIYFGATASQEGIAVVDPSGVPAYREFSVDGDSGTNVIFKVTASSDGSSLYILKGGHLLTLPLPLPSGSQSAQAAVEPVGGLVVTGAAGPGATLFVGLSPTGNWGGPWGLLKLRFGPAAPTDTTAPDISVAASPEPLGAEYATNESVGLTVGCTDPGPGATGVTSCDASVVDGHPSTDPGGGAPVADTLPTSGAGDKTLFVHAVDGAGNESTLRHTYTVVDGVGGSLVAGVQQRSTSSGPGSIDAAITAPTGGAFRLLKEPTATTIAGYQMFAQQVRAQQPTQTAALPASLEFVLDPTLLGGTSASQVKVFRGGTAVANCAAASLPGASPDPCVRARATVAGGGAKVTVLSSTGGTWTFGKVTATAPSAPTDVVITPGAKSAEVMWTAPSSDGGAPISASVITAVPSDGSIDPATGSLAVTRTKTVTGDATTGVVALSTGVTYDVTVKARNGVAPTYSPSSAPVSVTPLGVPNAPVISSVDPGAKSATVWWAVPDSPSAITGYTVVATRSADGAAITRSVPAAATSYKVTGLADGTEYSFTVAARSAAGTSVPSSAVAATTYALQGAPTDVAVVPGVRRLTVSWTPPATQSPLTGYTVVAEPTSGGATITRSVAASATSYALTGLANDAEYSVTVKSRTAVGTSAPSQAVAARTPALPAAPGNVTATPGASSAVLSWDDAAVDVAYPITRYTVQLVATRTDASTHSVIKYVNGSLGLPAATSVTVSGLEPGLTYSTTITATNAVGTGVVSAGPDVTPFNGLSVADVTTVEGTAANAATKNVSFTVRLSSKATADVSFTAATLDGTAIAPGDYVALSPTVFTIPAGSTTRTVTVKVARDAVAEPDETLQLVLSDIDGAIVTKGSASLTITNDD